MTTLSIPAVLPSVARGPQVLRSGQITVTVDGHLGAQQTDDGCWVVQWAPGCRIVGIASDGGPWHAMRNVPGDFVADFQGQVSLPLPVDLCDAVIVASGTGGVASPRPASRYASAGGSIDEATAVVFVPYAVEGVGPLLCPPAIGRQTNPIIRGLRGLWGPLPRAALDLSKLPSVVDFGELYRTPGQPRTGDADRIDPLAWNSWRPRIDGPSEWSSGWDQGQLQSHRFFAMDVYSEWRCAGRVPYTSHDGYGRSVAVNNSVSHLLLCSTEPPAAKAPLAFAMAQRGLHDLGRLADGCLLYPSGGHCWGRRANIILLGHLLGVDIFSRYDEVLGDRLPEDQLVDAPLWFGGHNGRWRFSNGDQANLGMHPSLWGPIVDSTHGSFAWQVDNYMWHVCGSQVGAVLATILYGRESDAPLWCGMIRNWMTPLPAQARNDLLAAGQANLVSQWGKGYGPERLAEETWRRYLPR